MTSRHQLVCAIVHGYPDAAEALADALEVPLPKHDQVVAAPDSHYMKDGRTIYTDAAVRLLRDGKPVFFVTVEMQREHARGKYATLHAYHGSGVEKINAGGHLFVLSDKPGTAALFRKEDADRRAELTFVASFHSGVTYERCGKRRACRSAPGRCLPRSRISARGCRAGRTTCSLS
jgi:hypothetical protein